MGWKGSVGGVLTVMFLVACSSPPPDSAQSSNPGQNPGGNPRENPGQSANPSRPGEEAPITVEVGTAQQGSLNLPTELVGRTQPQQEVAVRSRSEGLLQSLTVNVGDPVQAGQVLGQVDETLLRQALAAAQADLAAAQAEVLRIDAQAASAKTQVLTAQVELDQAQADATRLQNLANEGAVSQQQAEQAQTRLRAAQGSLQVAQSQIQTQAQLKAAALSRVQAQAALVAQAQERLDLTVLRAPLTGFILSRPSEVGNLLQNNQEVVTIGRLDPLLVTVEVSERIWSELRVGQSLAVRIPALDTAPITGTLTRRAPAANPTTRLWPVEVTIPNPSGQLGSGLLAELTIPSRDPEYLIVPQTAIQQRPDQAPQVFVFDPDRQTVQAQTVQLGDSRDGRQVILSGLKASDVIVLRSGRPLRPGQAVRPSPANSTPISASD
ncbi:MAG: efflux RND transporter periplasmic adaptor subunit [Synechococcales cyanobacterium]